MIEFSKLLLRGVLLATVWLMLLLVIEQGFGVKPQNWTAINGAEWTGMAALSVFVHLVSEGR